MVIERQFNGLPDIAHGGYVAGVMAAALGDAAAEVRLRRPVPTGRPLGIERVHGHLELRDGDSVLARATPADVAIDVPLPVTLAEAEAASRRFIGHHHHLFPHCFGCGTHSGNAGLRIYPGPVAGRSLVAAPWVPGDDGTELAWAALDCPQLWSLIVNTPTEAPERVVTAALATRVERPIVAGEPHVVMAWPAGQDGRMRLAGGAVIGPDGELSAVGLQTAATTDWGVPLGRAHWPNSDRYEEAA
jgi:hypothetical protein